MKKVASDENLAPPSSWWTFLVFTEPFKVEKRPSPPSNEYDAYCKTVSLFGGFNTTINIFQIGEVLYLLSTPLTALLQK